MTKQERISEIKIELAKRKARRLELRAIYDKEYPPKYTPPVYNDLYYESMDILNNDTFS